MTLLIAADTTAISAAARDLTGSMRSLPLTAGLPAIGEPDADAALGEVAAAFNRRAQDLLDASCRGVGSLQGFAVAFVSAGS